MIKNIYDKKAGTFHTVEVKERKKKPSPKETRAEQAPPVKK